MAQAKANVTYAFIAREGLVLCDHTVTPGNWQATGVASLAKCPKHNAKFTCAEAEPRCVLRRCRLLPEE